MENDNGGCPLLGMVRHSNAISNCAPAVALVTKMIKKTDATNYCLIHARMDALLCRYTRLFYFKIIKITIAM